MSDPLAMDQAQEPPRGAIVQPAYDDRLYVVIGRIPRPLQTDLVLREWLPSSPDGEPVVTTVDQRYCVIVALPQNRGARP